MVLSRVCMSKRMHLSICSSPTHASSILHNLDHASVIISGSRVPSAWVQSASPSVPCWHSPFPPSDDPNHQHQRGSPRHHPIGGRPLLCLEAHWQVSNQPIYFPDPSWSVPVPTTVAPWCRYFPRWFWQHMATFLPRLSLLSSIVCCTFLCCTWQTTWTRRMHVTNHVDKEVARDKARGQGECMEECW